MRKLWRWLKARSVAHDAQSGCPHWIQVLAVFYLILLPLLAVFYAKWSAFTRLVPSSLGPIPTAVLYFGALGGLYISLLGVIFHSRRWQDRYTLWHAVRPITGALTAGIGFLIFIVVIDSTGAKATKHTTATYDLIGFLIGYGEQAFLDLLKRATDTLLGPGDTTKVGGADRQDDGTADPRTRTPVKRTRPRQAPR